MKDKQEEEKEDKEQQEKLLSLIKDKKDRASVKEIANFFAEHGIRGAILAFNDNARCIAPTRDIALLLIDAAKTQEAMLDAERELMIHRFVDNSMSKKSNKKQDLSYIG